MLSTLSKIHCSQKQSECEDRKFEPFSSMCNIEIQDVRKPKRCCCSFWSSHPKQRYGKHAHCLITVLIYPLIYLILSYHLKMFYLGSCSMWVAENFNVIVGTEGIVVKTGVYRWSHHRNVGQQRPTVAAQLVCLLNSSSQCVYGIIR